MIPLVGFLPRADPRVQGTVARSSSELIDDGLVRRYDDATQRVDGLPQGEGVFLPCSFWLADNWALIGRRGRRARSSSGSSALCNDVGPPVRGVRRRRAAHARNFPQAFSHVALVNTALNLAIHGGARRRVARR